jgi:RNA polymerase subunit RPABC4/transcription elongation factor Spt4
MNWNNVSLVVLGLAAFFGAFFVALWASLVIWTFRDMRARSRDAFAQFLASLMVLVLGPFGIILYFVLRPRETLAEKYERSLEEEALLQDIEERQICPGCKQPIQPDYVLCPICHTNLRTPCIHCGRLIHPRWSLCPYCGQGQKPIPGLEGAVNVSLQDLEPQPESVDTDTPESDETQEPAPVFGETYDSKDAGMELEELPQAMRTELRKEADASMAAASPDEDEPKMTRKLRLPFVGPREESADAGDPEPSEPAEPTSDHTSSDAEKGTRQPLSLFRRR